MFSPQVEAIYGNEGPGRESWTVDRETVDFGEAEPIESRSEDSVVSKVRCAGCMSQLLVFVCGVSALQWQEDSANQQVGGASEFRAASAPAYSHGNVKVRLP